MSKHVSIDVFDERRGIREALDEPTTTTRTAFLGRALAAGGTLVAGGVAVAGIPALAAAARSPAQDVEILNLALLVEELEAAFYAEAERRARLSPELREFARVVGRHERAHVAFLRQALGRRARKRPSFAFGRATRERDAFAAAAVMLEDTAVAAYNGQAANLTKPALQAAASIVSVEARHAGWIRAILGVNPAPDPTDNPLSAAAAARALRNTGFVRG
jgi:rubrerythrin